MWPPPPFSSLGKGVLFIFSTELDLSSTPLALGKQSGRRTTIQASSNEPFQQSVYVMSEPLRSTADAALRGLLFGLDIGTITGAGPFLARDFHLRQLGLEWAFSSLLFACMARSILTGRLTDRFGRRSLLLWVAALFGNTCVETALARDFPSFLMYRFIAGPALEV
jgi:nitrate/nitrite transporter NarK